MGFPVISAPVQRACKAKVSYVPYTVTFLSESYYNLVACDHGFIIAKCVSYNPDHCGDWFCKIVSKLMLLTCLDSYFDLRIPTLRGTYIFFFFFFFKLSPH